MHLMRVLAFLPARALSTFPDPVLRAVPSPVVMEMMWPEVSQTTLGMSDPVYTHWI